MIVSLRFLIKFILARMPLLLSKMKQADMPEEPEAFIRKNLITALYMSLGISFIAFMIIDKLGKPAWIALGILPVCYLLMFMYMMKQPDVRIIRINKAISREIVFAGRFLVIELESGVPLYNAFKNIEKNYPNAGKTFQNIINKVDMGTPMEDAINEGIVQTPSPHIRKILWQVVNSLKTGSDASKSLGSIMDQIVKEQIILVKEYGKKLNPLAMFYMMIAVIIPTLGTTMLVVLSSFIAFDIGLKVLIMLVFALGFMQMMFLNIIRSSRPPVEL